MVDIHCHILPGVDDGAVSWKMALEMCRIAAQDGIKHIVATPHANSRYKYDRHTLSVTIDRLRLVIGEYPQLSLGCDFHLSFENVETALNDPREFAIGETSYLLVEMSDFAVSVNTAIPLRQLRSSGLIPIVTHPERNPILQRHPEWVVEWVKAGCLVQVTASSLTGQWGRPAKRAAGRLLRQKAVHVLASDAHDVTIRPPVLSAARASAAQLVGEQIANAIVDDNPWAIVKGQALPYLPEPEVTCADGYTRSFRGLLSAKCG